VAKKDEGPEMVSGNKGVLWQMSQKYVDREREICESSWARNGYMETSLNDQQFKIVRFRPYW
jgi:hypothetical protein